MDKKVLVVEDDAAVKKAVAFILEGHHHHVMPASGVEEALLLAPQADVILLDMKLGNDSGETFLQRLREAGNYTPVIVVSGVWSREAVERKLHEYKIVDFIAKPFRPKELLEKVQKAEQLSHTLESACEAADQFSAVTETLRLLAGKSITEIGRQMI